MEANPLNFMFWSTWWWFVLLEFAYTFPFPISTLKRWSSNLISDVVEVQ